MTGPLTDQERMLAALDWAVSTPERWDFLVRMALCAACKHGKQPCGPHRAEFEGLRGKDEVGA